MFWGSVEVFKENLKNWQGNFSKIATNFCEKRKYLGMAPLRGERPRMTATSGHMNSRFCGRKSREKLKMRARASRNGRQECLPYNCRDSRASASVRGDDKDHRSTPTLKIQRKVSIASWQLPNFLHFRFGAEHNSCVGHRSPSRDLSRYLINCRSGRALAKSAVSRLRSENREGNAEHSTPTNTEHQNRTSNAGV